MTSQDNAGEVVHLLNRWADVLEIPSGGFVNEDLRRAAALITSLVSEIDAQPQFDGLPKRKLDDLLARGWEVSGYAIHKDGEHGLVTTGGFVGWFTTAQNAVLTAERHLAEAREALKPFAEKSKSFDDAATEMGFPLSFDEYAPRTIFTHGQLRAARKALSTLNAPPVGLGKMGGESD